MKPLSPSVQALLDLWPELPHRVGADWPSLYWRALDLLRRYAALEDEERRAQVALEIARLLRTIPGGPEALRRFMLAGGERRGEEIAPPSAAELARQAEAEARLQALLHPPTVTRYTDIYAPARVAVGERFPIIVGLTRHPADEEVAAIQAQLNQLIRVVLTPRGPELLSEPARTLRVEEGESEPVVFYLRAVQVGTQSVLIDFYSQSDLLVSVTHSLTAEEMGVVSPPGKLPAQALRVGDYRAPYPDLVLRVCTRDNRLTYTLHYHNTEERIIEGDRLRADPEQYRYLLMREIENLAKGLDADGYPLTDVPDQGPTPEHIFRGLEKIGWRLYNELFNEALRREYRERIRGKVHTLEIVSDEPWIPWELVRPFGDGVDDDFLCLQYDFSRWVSGGAGPAAEIAVDSLACIAPTDSGLVWAQEEQAFVRSLAGRYGLADRSPAEARRGLGGGAAGETGGGTAVALCLPRRLRPEIARQLAALPARWISAAAPRPGRSGAGAPARRSAAGLPERLSRRAERAIADRTGRLGEGAGAGLPGGGADRPAVVGERRRGLYLCRSLLHRYSATGDDAGRRAAPGPAGHAPGPPRRPDLPRLQPLRPPQRATGVGEIRITNWRKKDEAVD